MFCFVFLTAEDLHNKQGDISGGNDEDTPANRAGMAPVKRRERPTTARPAPPKIKAAELAAVEEMIMFVCFAL